MAVDSSQNFLQRLGAQGYAAVTIQEHRTIAGRLCEAIEKRALPIGDLDVRHHGTPLLFAIGPPFMPLLAGIEERAQDHTCAKSSNNAAAGHAARPVWPGMLVRKRSGHGQHAMLPEEMSRAFLADARELLLDFRKLR